MKKIFFYLLVIFICSCDFKYKKSNVIYSFNNQEQIKKKLLDKRIEEIKSTIYYPLGVIGGVENVYIKNMLTPFLARIDTGATTSSIGVENIKEFERDGKAWVSFTLENKETKEIRFFEKKIFRRVSIKRQEGENERRFVVKMEIRIGNQLLEKDFTLGNREDFDYQILIGRNVLNGLAVVDVALEKTLN